jgi:ferrous-iron efflux pump FieF
MLKYHGRIGLARPGLPMDAPVDRESFSLRRGGDGLIEETFTPKDVLVTHDHHPRLAQPGSASIGKSAGLTAGVTALSVGCAAVLIVLKVVAWRLSGSIAVLASLADSGLDLLAALATFFAVRYAAAPPDADHRFGHGKAEAFASLVQSGLVFASSILIGQEAIAHMVQPKPLAHEGAAMAVMAVSTVLTSLLVLAQTRVLKQASSVAVSSDRAHYVADVASNLAALAGVVAATLFKAAWIDALAGLVVAIWLLWGAISVFRTASVQLLDRELSDAARERIRALAADDPAILDIHELRTRASGPYVHIQMHAELPADITLETAHRIIIAAEQRVLQAFPAADILIHADPHGRAEPHGGPFGERGEDRDEHKESHTPSHG